MGTSYVPSTTLTTSHNLPPCSNPGRRRGMFVDEKQKLHFIDEKTKAQEGQVSSPSARDRLAECLDSNPEPACSPTGEPPCLWTRAAADQDPIGALGLGVSQAVPGVSSIADPAPFRLLVQCSFYHIAPLKCHVVIKHEVILLQTFSHWLCLLK